MSRLNDILKEIRELEANIIDELRKREEELEYTIEKGRIKFNKEILSYQKKFRINVFRYIFSSTFLIVLTAPFIYFMFFPAIILHFFVTIYQTVCFPVYGIPKVKMRDYLIFDRHLLQYLNILEKFNCTFCSYFNALVGFTLEIAARTEQYWCPIKNARINALRSSRLHNYFDYGDAEKYRSKLNEVQKEFNDIKT